jgi:hypothetical protein
VHFSLEGLVLFHIFNTFVYSYVLFDQSIWNVNTHRLNVRYQLINVRYQLINVRYQFPNKRPKQDTKKWSTCSSHKKSPPDGSPCFVWNRQGLRLNRLNVSGFQTWRLHLLFTVHRCQCSVYTGIRVWCTISDICILNWCILYKCIFKTSYENMKL